MSPNAKNNILRWLDNVFSGKRPEGGATSIQIMQAHAGGGESQLHELQYEDDSTDHDTLEIVGLADQITEDDAQQFGSTQRYCMVAWFGAGRIHHQRSPVWVVSVRQENEALVSESEPATEKGMRAQQMRHNEAIMKVALGAVTQQMEIQRRMLERLSEQNEALQDHRLESIKVVERMLTQDAQRKLDERKAEAHEKRMGAAFEQISLLIPVVVNKVAGQNLLPSAAASPAIETLRQVLSSLDEKQLMALQKILTPAQAIAVWDLWETFKKENDEKEKKARDAKAAP